jgi:hypothetical protein
MTGVKFSYILILILGYFLKNFEGVNIKVVLKEDYFKEYCLSATSLYPPCGRGEGKYCAKHPP